MKLIDVGQSHLEADVPESAIEHPYADAQRIRESIREHQGTLNVRSGLFLAVSGSLFAVHSSLVLTPVVSVALATAGVLVSILWLGANYQYVTDIRILKEAYERYDPNDPVVRALSSAGTEFRWFKPTTIVAIYLPILGSIGWFVLLVVVWP